MRIRPSTAGFVGEAEGGIKSAFGRLAKVAAAAFAVERGFEFGKEIVGHAADVQKQLEAVRAEFGAASESVVKFGEDSASAFGISNHAAETAAARFGIIFKNLGIGQEAGAKMTIGFEKLAGSLALIRNVDPSTILKNIPLAVQGNLRSLKQLGISTDQTQLKLAAIKLGLIGVKGALDPTTRAQAIYAIATAHLNDFQKQAADGSNDLATKQRILSAVWDNAKDRLGAGLLPAMTTIVTTLSNVLPGALKIAGRAFGDLGAVIKGVADFIRPAFKPIIDEIERVRAAFAAGGIHAAIAKIKEDFLSLSPAGKVAVVAIGAVTAALVLFLATAAPITVAVLAIAGIAVGFREAYQSSARFRDGVKAVEDFITGRLVPAIKSIAGFIGKAFEGSSGKLAGVKADIAAVAKDIVSIIQGLVTIGEAVWKRFGSTITTVVKNSFGLALATIRNSAKVIRGIFDVLSGLIHGDWGKAWKGLKEIAGAELGQAKAIIVTFVKNVAAIFVGLWHSVEKITLEGLEKFVSLLAKIPTSFTVFGQKIGIDNPFKGIDKSLKKNIYDLGQSARDAAEALPSTISEARDNALAKANANSGRIAAALNNGDAKKAAADAGKTTKTVADALTKQYTDLIKTQDAGIAKARGDLKQLGIQLAQSIKQEAQDVADAVGQAKQNLTSIGSTLASSIGALIDKPLQDAQNKISAFGNRKSLEDLRRSVLLPGGKQLSTDPNKALAQLQALAKSAGNINKSAIQSFILQYQSAVLAVKQDQANVTKEGATRRIADLTDAFNRHKISFKTFQKDILAELTRDHVSYRKAGGLLGSAFANGFRDQVKGLLKQAGAIQAVPASRRDSITGAEPTIVKPLETLQKDQRAIAKEQHTIANKQVALQIRIAKATEKSAELNAKIHALVVNPDATSKSKLPGHAQKRTAALNGTTG